MDESEAKVKEMAEKINESIDTLNEAIEGKASVEDLEAKHKETQEKLDKLASKEDMSKQQEQLDDISTKIKQIQESQGVVEKSVGQQILENLKSEDFQNKMKPKGGKADFEIKLKAANIDTDDINSGTIETQIEPGVDAAPWRNTPLRNAIRWGTIGQGRDSISWWEETTRTQSAEMVTEQAAPSVGSAKTWTKHSMDIMMIKDFTKVTKSALEDFEYINSEIQDLMSHGIPRLLETELLNGVGTSKYLKGIKQYAQAFACPANFDKVPEANIADVLMAAILQVNNGNTSDTHKKGYMPTLIFLNPGSVINMQLLKKTDGGYLLPPFVAANGVNVGGVRVVTSLDLAAGEFLVGDFNQAKAYMKRNMRISFHYENEDDVLNDLVLVLASMRVAGIKVTSHGAYAFVKGTFDAAKPLIEETTG